MRVFYVCLFVKTFANITFSFKTRSGPLEDLRRLGKLFSEEYSSDLDKVDIFFFNGFSIYFNDVCSWWRRTRRG